MIGPHQGKELELMIQGKKHLSAFSEEIIEDHSISEEIIPDNAFEPHIKSGLLKRFSKDIYAPKTKITIRYVCFTSKDNEWRANTFFWIKDLTVSQGMPSDDIFEAIIGRLLNYEEEDIQDYLRQNRLLTSTIRA